MIHSIKIPKDSVIGKIGVIPETINFVEGVNIIFSPNGSGKSVLLKSISHYLPVVAPEPAKYKGFGEYSWDSYLSNAINPLEIEYDGGAVHLFENFSLQDTHGRFQSENANMMSAISEMLHKPSSGQKIIKYINKMMNLDTEVKLPSMSSGNDAWKQASRNFIDFYSQYKPSNRPTLLLDELDASLDPDKGLMYLDSVLSSLAVKFQIICVSHNPLIPMFDWYNVLDFYPDKSLSLKTKLKWLYDRNS